MNQLGVAAWSFVGHWPLVIFRWLRLFKSRRLCAMERHCAPLCAAERPRRYSAPLEPSPDDRRISHPALELKGSGSVSIARVVARTELVEVRRPFQNGNFWELWAVPPALS